MNGARLVVQVIMFNRAAVWRVSQYSTISSLQKHTGVCVCARACVQMCVHASVFSGDRLGKRWECVRCS